MIRENIKSRCTEEITVSFAFRFPWHYCVFWSSLLMIVYCTLTICYFMSYIINMLMFMFYPCTWMWHGFLLLIDVVGFDVKSEFDPEKIDDNLKYFFFIWPSGALWWALLRDGFSLMMVLYLILTIHFRPAPPPIVSAPFDGRPLNPPIILITQRDRMRPERRRQQQQQRRSSFVIHYVLSRMGRIRRRRRKFHD